MGHKNSSIPAITIIKIDSNLPFRIMRKSPIFSFPIRPFPSITGPEENRATEIAVPIRSIWIKPMGTKYSFHATSISHLFDPWCARRRGALRRRVRARRGAAKERERRQADSSREEKYKNSSTVHPSQPSPFRRGMSLHIPEYRPVGTQVPGIWR